MTGALDRLLCPRSIAVIGASSKRPTRGNLVIRNLQKWGFSGQVVPIHAQAGSIEGLPAANSIEDLPSGVDVAFVSVPASGVADVVRRLDAAGVPAAVVISNGFTPNEESELRALARTGGVIMHGPNCMGLINVSESVPLYTAEITANVGRGKVALLVQSGSAGIALMNVLGVGLSKIVTLGSEFRLTSTDYLHWLADDPHTGVVGLVLESIQDPEAFALAVRAVHAAGKHIVALKVGRSAIGALAAQAHTGSMITPADAYDCFFRQCGVPTVADYEQMAASLECLATVKSLPKGPRIGILGISGGETALACDIAGELGIPMAHWSDETSARVRQALPGATGRNPLDLGASIGDARSAGETTALDAIASDPSVDILVAIQDAQATLPPQLVGKYRHTFDLIAGQNQRTPKPVVLISPTPDAVEATLRGDLPEAGVPVLRGLRAGLAATRSLGIAGMRQYAAPTQHANGERILESEALDRLKAEIREHAGPLPVDLCRKVLCLYGIPVVQSTFLRSPYDPLPSTLDYPVVVKICSPDIPHRSDIGGVRVGVSDETELRRAMQEIGSNAGAARPGARIEGYEIQQQMTDCVEAMAGFAVARPLGPLVVVGSGGTLTELVGDRTVELNIVSSDRALDMIRQTRLGKVLDGYRNLIPKTSLVPLARLVANLSRMAVDLADVLSECDLNPVMIRKRSGDVRAVDVLLIAENSK